MHLRVTGFLLLCLVAVALVIIFSRDRPRAATAGDEAEVVFVIDGDTVDLRFGATVERLRLLGVDTPETVDEKRPVQCYGPEATAFTRSLLPTGTRVRVVRDVEARDRFGRLLGYVFRVEDGLFVNRALLDTGHATSLPIDPNTAYRGEFDAARSEAARRQIGLWGACTAFGVAQ